MQRGAAARRRKAGGRTLRSAVPGDKASKVGRLLRLRTSLDPFGPAPNACVVASLARLVRINDAEERGGQRFESLDGCFTPHCQRVALGRRG